ncbi:MAG: superoxide dismutase family protein [Huintestinicola sp.]
MTKPEASAIIKGSSAYPRLVGKVDFYRTDKGTVVCARINGLPYSDNPCENDIYGFHIHSGTACSGNQDDPFAGAMAHYDPNGCMHPYHAGDMPPLFGSKGYALMSFLTDRFSVDEIIGRTVIIHRSPDDLTTQPSGNSGTKIACGIIERNV